MPEYSEIASGGQANAEVAINENMALLSFLTVYGKKVSTSTGLNWGYYGGTWGPYDITAGTLTLTNTATNYIVVARATGVISVSTTNTNWNDATNYARVYQITVAGGVITVVADRRGGPGGVHGQP